MDQIIIRVDTHKANHIAVAINSQGGRLGSTTIPTTDQGYRDIGVWASRFGLVRDVAAVRPGRITSPTASAKAAMRAIARRWLAQYEEVQMHEQNFDHMGLATAPDLMKSHGISTMTVAEILILILILILIGDTPDRISLQAALARLCGVCPIPAASGTSSAKKSRHLCTQKPAPNAA